MRPGELIFGTDGVRDRAGSGLLHPQEVRKIARAAAWVLRSPERFPQDFPGASGGKGATGKSIGKNILIGRDTRASGPWIASILGEEFRRAGFPVLDLGVIPTPGIARMASEDPGAFLAAMVSASHNPAEHNGIKFLSATGAKVSAELEMAVSGAYWRSEEAPAGPPAPLRGDPGAVDRYVRSLLETVRRPGRLEGKRIVLDTAHGATHEAAPRIFRALGAEVVQIGDRPDGSNINSGCGTLHPEELSRAVVSSRAVLGFSFDGDGDRMIPVTASGEVLDGDHALAVTGRSYHRSGRLPHRTVVATTMSNLGLEKALHAEGLRLLRTPVGDRHVYREMVRGDHPVGGEQSGHLIFLDDARTGDGILAAIRLVDCLEGDDLDLAGEARIVVRYPQVLLNFPVPRKVPFEDLPRVAGILAEAEKELGGDGRIVLRYSGTEPLARVMIEGPDIGRIDRLARRIGAEIQKGIPC